MRIHACSSTVRTATILEKISMVEDTPVRFPLTRRALAKQQTRRRLIAAAKLLVAERGYEAATLRDVSAMAQVSTGAVFASFADKADLFNQVIIEGYADLLTQMKRIEAAQANTHETLLNMFSAGYALHAGQGSLVQAQMGFSWSNDSETEQLSRAGVRMIISLLVEVLRKGVQTGELATTIDTVLVAEMAWDSYVANYRRAVFDGWALDTLRARISRQIDILLDGYRFADHGVSQSTWPASVRGAETALRA
jgi:AcrR family transcriptional regulator